MNNLWIAFAVSLVVLVGSFVLFEKDIMAPSVVFSAVFSISIAAALYNYDVWNVSYEWNSLSLILLAIVQFALVNYVVYQFFKRRSVRYSKESVSIQFTLAPVVSTLFALGAIIGIVLYVKNVLAIAGNGAESTQIGYLINRYHQIVLGEVKVSQSMPFLVNQLVKLIQACAYVASFSIVVRFVTSQRRWWALMDVVTVLCFVVFALFSSSRMLLMELLAASVTYAYLIYQHNSKWQIKATWRIIVGILGVFVLFLVAFYYATFAIGRNTGNTMLYYIAYYAGGSIPLFQLFVTTPLTHPGVFGYETFFNLNQFLVKMKVLSIENYSRHLEFRGLEPGVYFGNVYTGLRRYLSDFGMIGMMILELIFSLFFTVFYYSIRYDHSKRFSALKILLYGYCVSALFLHSVDDTLFSSILSVNGLSKLFLIAVVYGLFSSEWLKTKMHKMRMILLKR